MKTFEAPGEKFDRNLFSNSIYYLVSNKCIIYLYSNKKLYEKVVNIDTKMAVLVLLSAILSFLGLYLFWYVLHNNKAAYAVSCVHPLFISFAILLSYFFYKEKINRYESLGILLVLLGIIVINYNKKHSK